MADVLCNHFTKAAINIRGAHNNLTELDFAHHPSIETTRVAQQVLPFDFQEMCIKEVESELKMFNSSLQKRGKTGNELLRTVGCGIVLAEKIALLDL